MQLVPLPVIFPLEAIAGAGAPAGFTAGTGYLVYGLAVDQSVAPPAAYVALIDDAGAFHAAAVAGFTFRTSQRYAAASI